ncbi:MAG: GC-type dockerin domain-anchored protein [Phycisphaerales bacterium]|jgi:hypothetical protein|nr:GC-type dockerin domain-anchored protein [Phycisphaerales bacterium]
MTRIGSGPARCAIVPAVLALTAAPALADGLRVVTWNITNYSGGRIADIQNVVYGQFEGRSMSPDAILVQEVLSQSAVNDMLSALNTAPGSPGDWAAAPFINGNDTDNAFFYRTSKAQLDLASVIATGSGPPNHPRDVNRYDITLTGYDGAPGKIFMYCSHMKAGSASDDQARRLLEAQRIRDNAETLPPQSNFLFGADTNIQTSGQAAYVELVGSQSNNTGRFFDPISTPGSWNNNSAYRFVHTQDPIGAGGMDDRHDQLLISATLFDGNGIDYIGQQSIPYSTTTWNDPNHSYRVWGNDGTSFDSTLRTTGNTMVGPSIAQSIQVCAAGGGHIPVYLDLRVPSVLDADTVIDFGDVALNSLASLDLSVANAGNVALWGASGVATLSYTLNAPAPFSVASGPHTDAAGGSGNTHAITLDTSSVGDFERTLTIGSNDPFHQVAQVTLRANVIAACLADWNLSGGAPDSSDFLAYLNDWTAGVPRADLAPEGGDGEFDSSDFLAFLNLFVAGC